MDWRTFTVEMVQALAWPATAVFAILLLREPVLAAFRRLSGIGYKDFRLHFGAKLSELTDSADSATGTPLPAEKPAKRNDRSVLGSVQQLAAISPRGAITEAWRQIELSLRDYAQAKNVGWEESIPALLPELEGAGLSRGMARLLYELRLLRNQAVHARDLDIDPQQALDYGRLADHVVSTLQALARR
jgi:hypothetical protein